MTDLPPLPAPRHHQNLETAQRFLEAAYQSVESMLEWHSSAFELAEDGRLEQDPRAAKWEYAAENMLRAILVFSGAGLDSTLKQAIRDAVPALVEIDHTARSRFEAFAQNRLDPIDGARTIARYLTSPSPRQALLDDYLTELTHDSLQSVEAVATTAATLGATDRGLFKRIKDLRSAFNARNEVVHTLRLILSR